MSSEDDHGSVRVAKRHQTQRACDPCRRRKKKCDGLEMPDQKCSNCLLAKVTCTYEEPSRRRLTTQLEQRLNNLEGLLQHQSRTTDVSGLPTAQSAEHGLITPDVLSSPTFPPHLLGGTQVAIEPGDNETRKLAQWLEQMRLDPTTPRFHGESMSQGILADGMGLKGPRPGGSLSQIPVDADLLKRRKMFWRTQPWEQPSVEDTTHHGRYRLLEFPSEDLLPTLIDKYFDEVDVMFPLLYRPAFDRSVSAGLHLRSDAFAYVLLLVCALGSLYVDDARVRFGESPLSSGWKYFHQVQLVRKSLIAPPTLYDLQICCLASYFLASSSTPQAFYSLIGTGIRMAVDIGLHRRQVYSSRPNVQEEQWKRAFWILMIFDMHVSVGMGRPGAIQTDDIDTGLPLEVDDEYWENSEDPTQAFKQPPGKPARVSKLVWDLKLSWIMSAAMKAIYKRIDHVDQSRLDPEWERKVAPPLDSAMNEWADLLPDHLRWDPKREDMVFLHQSAALWTAYYKLQMMIHRAFVPQSGHAGRTAVSSLAIVLNAARACGRVLNVQSKRTSGCAPTQIGAAFTSGSVLLFNLWSNGRDGLALDPTKELADVQHCLYALKRCETRYPSAAGRFWDILSSLVGLTQLRLSAFSQSAKRKYPGDEHPVSHPMKSTLDVITPADSSIFDLEPQNDGYILVGWATVGFIPAELADSAQASYLSLEATDASPSSSSSGPRTEDVSFLTGVAPSWQPEPGFSSINDFPSFDYTQNFGDVEPEIVFPAFNPAADLFASTTQFTGASLSSWPHTTSHHTAEDTWDAFFKNVARETNDLNGLA